MTSTHFQSIALCFFGLCFLSSCSSESPESDGAQDAETQTATPIPVMRDLSSKDVITNELAKEQAWLQWLTVRERNNSDYKTTGPPVRASDYPWQVGLKVSANGKEWRCGGILISPQFVLTAAHCVDAASAIDFSIIAKVKASGISVYHGSDRFGGSSPLRLDTNWGTVVHPYWKSDRNKPMAYDAALIKLASPITGATAAPIRSAAVPKASAVVSGWGHFNSEAIPSNVLRAVAVPIADNTLCIDNLDAVSRPMVTETTLCTVSVKADACSGDSGGPLVIGSRSNPQTIGIVSWGPPKKCAAPGPKGTLVGGYTISTKISQWVSETTSDPSTTTSAPPEPMFLIDPSKGI